MFTHTVKRFIGTQESKFLKKFYKKATVEYVPESNGYKVTLDGRNISTPQGHKVVMPNKELAIAVAHEFNMQSEYLKPATMPLLSMIRTCVDQDHSENTLRPSMIDSLFNFLQSDTVRYRDGNDKLREIQYNKLNPIIEFANQKYGINMQATEELFAEYSTKTQEEKDKVINSFDQLSNWKLMALEHAASNMKSTSLAAGLMENVLSIEEAVGLSYLEEDFQIAEHGLVEGSHDLDRNTTQLNVSVAKLVYDLSK